MSAMISQEIQKYQAGDRRPQVVEWMSCLDAEIAISVADVERLISCLIPVTRAPVVSPVASPSAQPPESILVDRAEGLRDFCNRLKAMSESIRSVIDRLEV